jgi:predicted NUDIX family NTP pyrophosphohydrolase
MPKRSAGLLVYRSVGTGIEVLAVHPGGPFWAKKDKGAWSIPKGEIEPENDRFEDAYSTARREFAEEIGSSAPLGEPLDLGEIRQASGKIVRAFALPLGEGEGGDYLMPGSNVVELEWPRGSGRLISFPEVDKAEWMSPGTAREKLVRAQVAFIDRLLEALEA